MGSGSARASRKERNGFWHPVILILVASAVFTLIMVLAWTSMNVSFLGRCLETKATVIGLYLGPSEYGLDPIFQFTDSRTGRQIIAEGTSSGYVVGDVVDILYDPDNPAVNVRVNSFYAIWAGPIGTAVTSCGCWFMVYILARIYRQNKRTPTKHRITYDRAPNYVFVGVTCLFIIPMFILLVWLIGVNIWTVPPLIILGFFLVLALIIVRRPRRVLQDV